MLVELTELAFVLLLECVHPRLNMLTADALGSIVFQRRDRLSAQQLPNLTGWIRILHLLFSFALRATLIVNRQPLRLIRLGRTLTGLGGGSRLARGQRESGLR